MNLVRFEPWSLADLVQRDFDRLAGRRFGRDTVETPDGIVGGDTAPFPRGNVVSLRAGDQFKRHPVGVQEGQDHLAKATLPLKDQSAALLQPVFPEVEGSLWN